MKFQLGCLPMLLVLVQAVLIGMNLSRDTPASWLWVLAPTWMTVGTLVLVFVGLLILDIVKNPLNRKDR